MHTFEYRKGQLACEAVPLISIAATVGTPVYVYSQAEIVDRSREYVSSVSSFGLACYAIKANGNPSLIRLIGKAGLGADVTSGGELFLAMHAGIPADRIIFSGVGKTGVEIETAIKAGIHSIHVESEMELAVVSTIATRLQKVAPFGVRINPNIDADTHPYISTGLKDHKFGVLPKHALSLYRTASVDPWLRPVGVAAHLGSQITELGPFVESADYLVAYAQELASIGINLSYLDIGGGLGIDYRNRSHTQLSPPGETVPDINAWTTAVIEPIKRAGFTIVMEPGRSIVGPSGMFTRCTYTKKQGERHFIITDAGMNDLLRPTLYNAPHPMLRVKEPAKSDDTKTYDIVGPICESGDWLAKSQELPHVKQGDLLAVMQAGAYGFAMSSNYNGRPRPAEVLVDRDQFHVIRQRQSYEHLLDGCT